MYKKITLLIILLISGISHAQNWPTGFNSIAVTEELENIVCFTFVDEDKILLGKQSGEIYLIENGLLASNPIVRISTIVNSTGGDRGLVGITMDPNYPISPYVYVTYTVAEATHNRVSRFQLINSSIDLASEEVLLDLSPLDNVWHVGGALEINNEGYLFTSTGDNSLPGVSQSMATTHGKVLRIFKDGSIPVDNPYYTGSGEPEDLIWAMGLRNPYSMAMHQETGTLFVNDVGQFLWEEVNDASSPGRNFGWPEEEGYNSTGSTYDSPSYAYPHTDGTSDWEGNAITGGAFYDPEIPKYPTDYIGKYFFIEFNKKWINTITPEFDNHDHIHDLSSTRENFASNIAHGAIYLKTSPDGYLYFFSRVENIFYKIVFHELDTPLIFKSPEDTTTMVGERTRFTVQAAGAPDLNYEWYRDGTLIYSANNAPLYTFPNTQINRAGDYQIRVFNDFGEAWSDIFTLTVIPFNEAPVPTILSPTSSLTYQAGETIFFDATATDAELGDVPAENFEWFVKFHHDNHNHDGPAIATGTKNGNYTISDIGETSSNVWFEFIVRVTDDIGQKVETSVDIYPQISEVNFVTSPENLKVNVAGPNYQTPYVSSFVEHLKLPVGTPAFQTINGVDAIYRFSHWSETVENGLFTIPDDDIQLTAHFAECTNPNPVTNFDFTVLSETSTNLTWDGVNMPCIKEFILVNQDTMETIVIPAYNEETVYLYSLTDLSSTAVYSYGIATVNEYGTSEFTYINFTLDLDDTEALSRLKVFPNPAKDIVIINGFYLNENYQVELFSVLGKKLISANQYSGSRQNFTLNVSKFENGVYFLKIKSSSSEEKTFKLIISN